MVSSCGAWVCSLTAMVGSSQLCRRMKLEVAFLFGWGLGVLLLAVGFPGGESGCGLWRRM